EMFLGGKFRRIIDAETRLLAFESALVESPDVFACWDTIRSGSHEFGFQGVRMSLDGQLFQDFGSRTQQPAWQLRVPLPRGQYVKFVPDCESSATLPILDACGGAVEVRIKSWSGRRATSVPRMPAASDRLTYAAGAGATPAAAKTATR